MENEKSNMTGGAYAELPDGGTPGPWFVRKLEKDGELRGCFVAAPDYLGMPYDAEILGDDEYRDKPESDETSGMRRRLADCELIVAAVNQYRASHGQAAGATDPQLLKFYGVSTDAELIAAQVRHIQRLQSKLPQTPSLAPQRVREG